jgi:hypothetical protein
VQLTFFYSATLEDAKKWFENDGEGLMATQPSEGM